MRDPVTLTEAERQELIHMIGDPEDHYGDPDHPLRTLKRKLLAEHDAWSVEAYSSLSKTIVIQGPGYLTLYLDNDDVNPEDIEQGLPRIVEALNAAWR